MILWSKKRVSPIEISISECLTIRVSMEKMMTRGTNSDLQKILDQHSLKDILRIGIMLASRDKKKLTVYFLEMAMIDCDDET